MFIFLNVSCTTTYIILNISLRATNADRAGRQGLTNNCEFTDTSIFFWCNCFKVYTKKSVRFYLRKTRSNRWSQSKIFAQNRHGRREVASLRQHKVAKRLNKPWKYLKLRIKQTLHPKKTFI